MEPQERQNHRVEPTWSSKSTLVETTTDSVGQLRSFKPFVLFFYVMALIVISFFGLAQPTGKVAADDTSPTPTPLLAPPRGVAGDLWADTVIGPLDFLTTAPNQTVNNKLDWANGVVLVTNTNSLSKALFIYDSGNNRILGVNINNCLLTPSPTPLIAGATPDPGIGYCHASIVIGQPDMRSAGCNRDSGFQHFPFRSDADADTLCGQPEKVLSTSETGSGANMAIDAYGRLYVADFFNNRVLRYPNFFITPTPSSFTPTPTFGANTPTLTPTAIRADAKWGQPNFTGNSCNWAQPFTLAHSIIKAHQSNLRPQYLSPTAILSVSVGEAPIIG